MSTYDLESPTHDVHVSIAIEAFLERFGGVLLYSDGRLTLSGHITQPCPIFQGYRPDAVITNKLDHLWFIEVKSYKDIFSTHTRSQFLIISNLMTANTHLYLYVFIFNSFGENVFFPAELDRPEIKDRVVIVYPAEEV